MHKYFGYAMIIYMQISLLTGLYCYEVSFANLFFIHLALLCFIFVILEILF